VTKPFVKYGPNNSKRLRRSRRNLPRFGKKRYSNPFGGVASVWYVSNERILKLKATLLKLYCSAVAVKHFRLLHVFHSLSLRFLLQVVEQEDILDNLDDLEAPKTSNDTNSSNSRSNTETDSDVIVVEIGVNATNTDDTDIADDTDVDIADVETPSASLSSVSFDEQDECDTGYLVLRGTTPQRHVPNGCAICLGPYLVGESVVWSSNCHCKHAFHSQCMVDWLSKAATFSTESPCPCCRREFTDLETYKKEKKILWEAGATFNPRQVRMR
jgi:hypothetical protein